MISDETVEEDFKYVSGLGSEDVVRVMKMVSPLPFEREENKPNVNVPIKNIIEQAMENNDVLYEDEYVLLLRKYFIAGLNMNYFELEDLDRLTDRFCSKVDSINMVRGQPKSKTLDAVIYLPDEKAINIYHYNSAGEECEDSDLHFFRAFTNVLFECDEVCSYTCIGKAIASYVADNIMNFDTNYSRIINPVKKAETISGKKIETSIGTSEYLTPSNVFRQFCICFDYHPISLIQKFFNNYAAQIKQLSKNSLQKEILQKADEIAYACINRRCGLSKDESNEPNLIREVETMMGEFMIKEKKVFCENHSFLAFLALCTTKENREKIYQTCEETNEEE